MIGTSPCDLLVLVLSCFADPIPSGFPVRFVFPKDNKEKQSNEEQGDPQSINPTWNQRFSLLGAINSPIPTLLTPTTVRGTDFPMGTIPEGKYLTGLS